jgi:hypothetical protein
MAKRGEALPGEARGVEGPVGRDAQRLRSADVLEQTPGGEGGEIAIVGLA